MSTLLQLQQNLQRYVMSGDTNIRSSISIPKGKTEETSLTRLHLYRNAYEARLIEALSANYPCLTAYMGNEAFADMATIYIHEYPSTYRSIRWFGDKLPDFLANYANEKASFLNELAEFEWKITLAFDARDTSCIQISDMAAIPEECWAQMTFDFHPSVQSMALSWNSVAIWEAIMNDALIPLPNPKKKTTQEAWVLWRYGNLNRFCSLPIDEACILDAARRGTPFGDLCEELCQWHKDEAVGLVMATCLKGWIQSGWIHQIIREPRGST